MPVNIYAMKKVRDIRGVGPRFIRAWLYPAGRAFELDDSVIVAPCAYSMLVYNISTAETKARRNFEAGTQFRR